MLVNIHLHILSTLLYIDKQISLLKKFLKILKKTLFFTSSVPLKFYILFIDTLFKTLFIYSPIIFFKIYFFEKIYEVELDMKHVSYFLAVHNLLTVKTHTTCLKHSPPTMPRCMIYPPRVLLYTSNMHFFSIVYRYISAFSSFFRPWKVQREMLPCSYFH